MKRTKYTLYLDQAQLAALRKISAATRIPLSVLVREGIDGLVKRYKRFLKS